MKAVPERKKQNDQLETLESVEVISETLSVEDELVERITKRVVAETMKTIRPLLEKLQEVGQAQQSEQSTQQGQEIPVFDADPQEQLKKMQAMANDRMNLLQQRVAKKMQRRQMRFS